MNFSCSLFIKRSWTVIIGHKNNHRVTKDGNIARGVTGHAFLCNWNYYNLLQPHSLWSKVPHHLVRSSLVRCKILDRKMNLPLDINTILHLGNFSSRTVSAKIIFRKGSLRKQPGTGGPTVTLGVSKADSSLNRNKTWATFGHNNHK